MLPKKTGGKQVEKHKKQKTLSLSCQHTPAITNTRAWIKLQYVEVSVWWKMWPFVPVVTRAFTCFCLSFRIWFLLIGNRLQNPHVPQNTFLQLFWTLWWYKVTVQSLFPQTHASRFSPAAVSLTDTPLTCRFSTSSSAWLLPCVHAVSCDANPSAHAARYVPFTSKHSTWTHPVECYSQHPETFFVSLFRVE